MHGFEHLEQTLKSLDEIVLTSRTLLFYSKNNNQLGISKELDQLKIDLEKYDEIIKDNPEF